MEKIIKKEKTEKTLAKKVVSSVEPKKVVPVAVPVKTPAPSARKTTEIQDIAEDDGITAADFIIPEKDSKIDKYYEAIGRRKTAVARVRLHTKGDKEFIVNDKPYNKYFLHEQTQESAVASLKKMKSLDRFRIVAKVKGGGEHAQAEAVRHGIARVLVEFNENFRKRLRKAGFLTRDPRMRERKKFGLRRARRAPQWAKR